MISLKLYLLILFIIKFALDSLSPFREFNFIILNSMCIFIIIVHPKLISSIDKREWIGCVIYFISCGVGLATGGNFDTYIKFVSLILLFITVRSIAVNIPTINLIWISEKAFLSIIALLFMNFCISLVVADPLSRIFYNFEHSNLLGTYALLSLPFLYVIIPFKMGVFKLKLLVSLMALATTSTGSFLSSLFIYTDFKKISARSIIAWLFYISFAFFCLYYFLLYFSPVFFIKIFGPFKALINEGVDTMVYAANYQIRIQDLDENYQGSLAWRIYAYIVFIGFILDQNIFNIFFGSGFNGFEKVWGGIAPHNDFILILIDLGLIGFLLFLLILFKAFYWIVRFQTYMLPLMIVLFLRLSFENNIYSFYIASSLVMSAALIYSFSLRLGNK